MKKFKKVTLSLKNLGLIKDRLDRLSAGIINIENAWTDNANPDHKNIDWGYCQNTVLLPQKSIIQKIYGRLCLIIKSQHASQSDIVFESGDIFFIKNGSKVIYIKPCYNHPISKGEKLLTKITVIGDGSDISTQKIYEKSEESFNTQDRYDNY